MELSHALFIKSTLLVVFMISSSFPSKMVMGISIIHIYFFLHYFNHFHTLPHILEGVSHSLRVVLSLSRLLLTVSIKLVIVSIVIALCVIILLQTTEPLHVFIEVRMMLDFRWHIQWIHHSLMVSACLVKLVEVKLLKLPFFYVIEFGHVLNELLLLEFRHLCYSIRGNLRLS
jgi:hypothetical protein